MSDMGDRLLRIVRDKAAEAPEPADTDAAAPLVSLPGQQMTRREQALAALRLSVERARTDVSRREGGVVCGLVNAKPPSLAEQREYAASRAWVPPGHEDGLADRAGAAYHAVIGRPGVALGNTISALCARPLRFTLAAFLLATVVLIAYVSLG